MDIVTLLPHPQVAARPMKREPVPDLPMATSSRSGGSGSPLLHAAPPETAASRTTDAAKGARSAQEDRPDSHGDGLRHHVPLRVEVYRGDIVESVHEVHGVILFGDGRGGSAPEQRGIAYGDADLVTTMRSSAKPFQVLPLLLDHVAKRCGLVDEDLAIASASHSGEPRHVELVRAFMQRTQVEEDELRCGRHRPFHKPTAEALGNDHTVLHHNCSGKHTAMLAWTHAHDLDPGTYLRPDHPVQDRILQVMSWVTDLPRQHITYASDGCGVPTFALSLRHMAISFRHLAEPEGWRTTAHAQGLPKDVQEAMVRALTRTRDVFADNPYLIAGTGRPDTDLGKATGHRLFAKAGAEGLWCGADRTTGTAFAFKALDGNFRGAVPAALAALHEAGVITAEELQRLEEHAAPVVKSGVGDAVGRLVARVPPA